MEASATYTTMFFKNSFSFQQEDRHCLFFFQKNVEMFLAKLYRQYSTGDDLREGTQIFHFSFETLEKLGVSKSFGIELYNQLIHFFRLI